MQSNPFCFLSENDPKKHYNELILKGCQVLSLQNSILLVKFQVLPNHCFNKSWYSRVRKQPERLIFLKKKKNNGKGNGKEITNKEKESI